MNEVLQLLDAHRSIRNYKAQAVSEQDLKCILDAATKASTSGNMQAYSIIVTKDSAMKERMYQAHFQQEVYKQAPVFLTFCADFHRMRRWIKLRDAKNNFNNFMSFMIASIDATLASQNAAIAAESLGLGICYLGTTFASADQIGAILELPENVVPIVGFTLGHPDESPDLRERLPIEAIVHQEKYQHYKDETILSFYQRKEQTGMQRYESLLKAMDITDIENLAQVYTQLKYTEESHVQYSESVLNYLEKQNF